MYPEVYLQFTVPVENKQQISLSSSILHTFCDRTHALSRNIDNKVDTLTKISSYRNFYELIL